MIQNFFFILNEMSLCLYRRNVLLQCSKLLAERANMMGQNYRLSHPLLNGCATELKEFSCTPSPLFPGSPNFHLSWVLLCLENSAHANPDKMSEKCQHEMVSHRKMMLSEFRLSPEVVLTCGRVSYVFLLFFEGILKFISKHYSAIYCFSQ